MTDALQVVKYSLKDLWDEFVLLILLNIVWTLTVLLPVVPFLIFPDGDLFQLLAMSLFLALPLPVVSGALCFSTNQVARGKAAGWGTFADGIRRYWLKSLVVAATNLVVLVLLAANLRFYTFVVEGTWTNFAVSAWLVVGLYWLLVQVFWFPLILEMEKEKVFLALRYALGLVIITPGFSLTLAVLMTVIVALCIVLTVPAALLMASLVLLMANHATRSRLAHIRKEPYNPGADLGS
jgi:hypothetical protein